MPGTCPRKVPGTCPRLRLQYHDSLADAVADLGEPEEIKKVFSGFQRYLYGDSSAA